MATQGRGAGGVLVGLLLVTVLMGGCSEDDDGVGNASGADATTSGQTSGLTSDLPSATVPAATPIAPGDSIVRVIDGDTFALASGQEIRVLGIDACEASTSAGAEATAAATSFLTGDGITITPEPGVDRDPYGRLLRYVSTSTGGDMGEHMVGFSHTAVYDGLNDAAAARVATLRSLDRDGRDCTDEPVAPVEPEPTYEPQRTYVPEPDRPYVPEPDRPSVPETYADSSGGSSGHTGDSGYPCGPGDRDGDGDGWCGES